MKKIYFLACIIFFNVKAHAQLFVPDSLYGVNSIQAFDPGAGDDFTQFLVQPDGMIVSCGFDYDINQNDFHIDMVRFDACGAIDSTFGTAGIVRYKFDQRNTAYGFALQQDGKFLSVGLQAPSNAGSQQIPYVARFNTDGTPDTTFATAGSNALRFDAISSGAFYSVAQLPDGRIVGMGRSSGNINGGVNGAGAMRFMPDGTLDSSFDGDGITRYSGLNMSFNEIHGFVLQDGEVVLYSNYYDASFNQHFIAVAFDSTGMFDTTFAAGGVFIDSANVNLTGQTMGAKQSDDKILLATQRTPATDGIEILRLMPDGSLDTSFGTAGRVTLNYTNVTFANIRMFSNNRIIVTGMYNSVGVGVVLNNDGSVDTTFASAGFMLFDLNNNTGGHNLDDIIELPGNRLLGGGSSVSHISRRYIIQSNVPHITFNFPDLSTTGTGTYQWYADSTIIPGATGSSHIPTQIGSYTVLLTDDLGCSYMSEPFIINSVNIIERSKTFFSAYPNPFSNELYVNTDADAAMLNVRDALGRILMTFYHPGSTSVIPATLDEGVYFLELVRNDNVEVLRVVKN